MGAGRWIVLLIPSWLRFSPWSCSVQAATMNCLMTVDPTVLAMSVETPPSRVYSQWEEMLPDR